MYVKKIQSVFKYRTQFIYQYNRAREYLFIYLLDRTPTVIYFESEIVERFKLNSYLLIVTS